MFLCVESRGTCHCRVGTRYTEQIWILTNKCSQDNYVEMVPKEKFGIFHDDCTYIIYASTIEGCIVNQNTIASYLFIWFVPSNCVWYKCFFFLIQRVEKWNQLRRPCTVSFLSGLVRTRRQTYKVMELDNHLTHTASQYREIQENESARFLSYFKNGAMEVILAFGFGLAGMPTSKKKLKPWKMHAVSWKK